MKFIKVLMVAMLMFSVLPAVPAHAHHEAVKVKRGDTLSKIAMRHDSPGGWQRLAGRNRLANPDVILVGQKLIIPHLRRDRKGNLLPHYPNYPQAQKARRSAPAASRSNSTSSSAVSSVPSSSVWTRLAQCESGGNWAANTGNGYYGGLQFLPSTWRSVGGTGLPHQHSAAEQIKRGQILQARAGWGQWPSCSAKLGLR